MRLGVIDCGTNTFHLLVAEVNGSGEILPLLKERRYVRLGQEGLGWIGDAPFSRGLACLNDFRIRLEEADVEQVRVFGTEALRKASNGVDFIRAVEQQTGIRIQLITGEEEARLIHLGVLAAVPPFEGKALIMDIGGGSVEFIIASREEVHWAKSFPIGVQVLFSEFHKNDPISQGDLLAVELHLEEMLAPLFEALRSHETPLLLGASGSFEVIEDLLFEEKQHPLFSILSTGDFQSILSPIVSSSLQDRRSMAKIPEERSELIVVAFVLVDFVIRKAGIRQIITSSYAMKEGILFEMSGGK